MEITIRIGDKELKFNPNNIDAEYDHQKKELQSGNPETFNEIVCVEHRIIGTISLSECFLSRLDLLQLDTWYNQPITLSWQGETIKECYLDKYSYSEAYDLSSESYRVIIRFSTYNYFVTDVQGNRLHEED